MRYKPNPYKNYYEIEPSKDKYKKQLVWICMIECLLVNIMNPSKIEKSIQNLIKIANEINLENDNEDPEPTILEDLQL